MANGLRQRASRQPPPAAASRRRQDRLGHAIHHCGWRRQLSPLEDRVPQNNDGLPWRTDD